MLKNPGTAVISIEAEPEMLKDFELREKTLLRDDRNIPIGDGTFVIVDGYSDSAAIVCEIWAKVGTLRGAQFHKIMKDAFKMVFLEKRQKRQLRKVLIFADEIARKPFLGKSWMAVCLKDFGVETWVANLPDDIKQRISHQQKELYR